MEKTTSKQRLDYIDVFRSLGIIAMVMGHISFGGAFDHFIHAFHMPMFCFISGFFYRRRDCSIGEYVGKKAKSLLIPYISFGIAHYLVDIILHGFSIKPLIYLFTFNTVYAAALNLRKTYHIMRKGGGRRLAVFFV